MNVAYFSSALSASAHLFGSVSFKVQVEVVFPSGFFGWSGFDSG